MTVLGFNHFNLKAERGLLEALRDFYRDAVGLRVGARPAFAVHGYWLYANDLAVLHLLEKRDGTALRTSPDANFDHVAFSCTGLAQTRERLRSIGVEFHERGVPGTDIVQLFLRDPAGNGVELNIVG